MNRSATKSSPQTVRARTNRHPATKVSAGELIRTATTRTRFGTLLVADTPQGICFAEFGPNRSAVNASLRAVYPQATPRQARANERPHQVLAALVAYLEGRGRCPTVEIDLRGSEFQCAVWRMLRRTKPGRILSYTELAQSLERPTAVRAVASACAANHIALLVPCHRVVRADGHLGGYRWGLTLKQHLLKHEQRR